MMNLNGIKALPTGNVIDLRRPKDYKFTVEEIAKLLHKVKRFNGYGISVCMHSVFVAEVLWHLTGNPHIALRGLFHDAQEAYIGDVATPVKDIVGSEWEKLETAIHDEILSQLSIRHKDNLTVTPLIKMVDAFALVEEVMWLVSTGDYKRDEQGIWDHVMMNTPTFLGFSPFDLTMSFVESTKGGYNDFIAFYDQLQDELSQTKTYEMVEYHAKDGVHKCPVADTHVKYFQRIMESVYDGKK